MTHATCLLMRTICANARIICGSFLRWISFQHSCSSTPNQSAADCCLIGHLFQPRFKPPRPTSLLSLSNSESILEDCHHLWAARARSLQKYGRTVPTSVFDLYLPNELRRAHVYATKYFQFDVEKRCLPCDLVAHVGDNPEGSDTSKGWTTWSAHSGKLPTIRRSSGLYFAIFENRHLLLRELYMSMGYPSMPACAQSAGLRCFNVFPHGLSYFDSLRALGNSMHVAQVGLATGVFMLSTRKREQEQSD